MCMYVRVCLCMYARVCVCVCVGNNSDPRVARMREAISLARGMVAHISKDTKETCIQ